MWKNIGAGINYLIGMTALTGVGLAFRYAENWSFTSPVDPTRQTLILDKTSRPTLPVSPSVVSTDSQQTTWEVAFVTGHDLPEIAEPSNSGDELHFGITEVTLPSLRTRGSLDLEPRKQSSVDITVRRAAARPLSEDEFYEHLQSRLPAQEPADVLVFVHGFNVSFHEAVCRVAQMAHDMPFSGVIVAFDWASQASSLGYRRDQQTVDATSTLLARTLARLRTELPRETRLHVLAHSMGNRLTLKALLHLELQPTVISSHPWKPNGSEIALLRPPFPEWQAFGSAANGGPPLTHLVFAAPDVDAESFAVSLTRISRAAQTMTLYCSDTDFAMEASRIANAIEGSEYRAGDSRSNIRHGKLHTIRLSGVNPADPFGHSYYGSHPGMLTDLSELLQHDRPPTQRATLAAGGPNQRDVWRLR